MRGFSPFFVSQSQEGDLGRYLKTPLVEIGLH